MRRALSQLSPASGSSWLAQLGVFSGQSTARSTGEASTSYSPAAQEGMLAGIVRCLSGKAAAKGKAAPAKPPPPPPAAARQGPVSNVLASAGARLRRKQPGPDPLAFLTPEQRQLADQLAPQRPSAAAEAAPAAPPAAEPLRNLGQLGLPLDRRDVASLLQQSLSAAAGQNVHFQPFVFSNVFQSAPAVASYVASALESGTAWSRVERFFLAAVEADDIVRGIKVEVRGRLARKADMAARKVWQWGEYAGGAPNDHLDYGAAPAFTRLGVLGVKVWIRYKQAAIHDVFFPPSGGSHYRTAPATAAKPSLSLDDLYRAAAARKTRVMLPYRFTAVGWWERTAAEQPPQNLVSEVFTPDFDPAAGHRLDAYLRLRREERRRFRSAAERQAYLLTTGRFLERQRRQARLQAGTSETRLSASCASDHAAAPPRPSLGRRPNRVLGRHRLEAVVGQRRRRSVRGGSSS